MFFLFNSSTTCTTAHPYTAPQFIRCLCCSIFFAFFVGVGKDGGRVPYRNILTILITKEKFEDTKGG